MIQRLSPAQSLIVRAKWLCDKPVVDVFHSLENQWILTVSLLIPAIATHSPWNGFILHRHWQRRQHTTMNDICKERSFFNKLSLWGVLSSILSQRRSSSSECFFYICLDEFWSAKQVYNRRKQRYHEVTHQTWRIKQKVFVSLFWRSKYLVI